MYIYADNAGTTKMSPVAIDAMTKCMNEVFGNPSSLHSTGQRAAEVLQKAREDVAEALGADFNEIYFTSGGSEADNQAIRSAALFGAKKGKKHLISTKIEHHAVLHTLKKLEREGFEVTLLDVGAVSYTHLDVYKRQDYCTLCKKVFITSPSSCGVYRNKIIRLYLEGTPDTCTA